MKKYWKKQFLTVWIAIFAILASALGSSISSALTLANSTNPGLTEICSTSQTAPTATQQASKKSDSGSTAHATEHCPFCLPHAGDYSLPPAVLACCAIAAGHDAFPPLFYQAPSLLFSWVKTNPRGPPQFS